METITIPLQEYLDLLELYQKINEKISIIKNYNVKVVEIKKIDAFKYCGALHLSKDALQIQKDMRDEWQ